MGQTLLNGLMAAFMAATIVFFGVLSYAIWQDTQAERQRLAAKSAPRRVGPAPHSRADSRGLVPWVRGLRARWAARQAQRQWWRQHNEALRLLAGVQWLTPVFVGPAWQGGANRRLVWLVDDQGNWWQAASGELPAPCGHPLDTPGVRADTLEQVTWGPTEPAHRNWPGIWAGRRFHEPTGPVWWDWTPFELTYGDLDPLRRMPHV